MKYSAIIALFIGAASVSGVKIDAEKHRHHQHSLTQLPKNYAQINSEAFADAAVEARVEADSDIANEVRHHHMVNAAAHNKAWKKHFKGSQFYERYAEHNEEQQKCQGECAENKKQLAQVKSDYLQLSDKFDELKKKADKDTLAKFEQQQGQKTEKAPQEVKHVLVEEESPFGLAGGAYGPAYPSPQPFVRGEKQWVDNAQNIEDWGKQQEVVANTRIPYASTLVQLQGNVLREDVEDDVNLDILFEKEPPMAKKNEVEKLSATTAVPLDFHFVETSQDDDPRNLENFAAEEVPLNAEFVRLKSH